VRFFDSHCHLQDDRIVADVDAILARARSSGLRNLLCCGSCEPDWEAVKSISRRYPEIVPAFGVHPWYVAARSGDWFDKLETLLVEFPAAAVGEIGLDHAIDERNDEDQATVFTSQLALARKLGRPVSVHCRKAWAAMLTILQKDGLPHGGVIHSWSGSPELIPLFEKAGASISFSGSITFDRNRKGRASAAVVSANRLLIETDAPDCASMGIAKGENEPANLPGIAEQIAAIRGTTVTDIAELTYKNALGIFLKTGLSDPTFQACNASDPDA
jgi:TatD DNase family protein